MMEQNQSDKNPKKRGRRVKPQSEANESTKDRILQEAQRLFGENGFDGTGITEIADAANVDKALIFYYFKNKGQLLEAVIEKFINEAVDARERQRAADPSKITLQALRDFVQVVMKLAEDNRETINILLSEALKKSDGNLYLFEFVGMVTGNVPELAEQYGLDEEQTRQLLTTLVFMDILPILVFSSLSGKWSQYTGCPKEMLQDDFTQVFCDMVIQHLYDKYFS
jgi:AcrR family transcriptional regulator